MSFDESFVSDMEVSDYCPLCGEEMDFYQPRCVKCGWSEAREQKQKNKQTMKKMKRKKDKEGLPREG